MAVVALILNSHEFKNLKTPILCPGPEFGEETNCIFIGMATEDLDVAELVETIGSVGRDIEESGKVLIHFLLFLLDRFLII